MPVVLNVLLRHVQLIQPAVLRDLVALLLALELEDLVAHLHTLLAAPAATVQLLARV